MDDLGPNKGKAKPQISSAEKSRIEQALRNQFLREMDRQFKSLQGNGEVKFIGDISVNAKEQVWKDVYANVFEKIVPLIPDSQHAALAQQFSSVKTALMRQVHVHKQVRFVESDQEDPFDLGPDSEAEESEAEESDEEEESEEEQDDLVPKVIVEKEPSLFAKAKQAVGGFGGRFTSLFSRNKEPGPYLEEESDSESDPESDLESDPESEAMSPPGPVTLLSTRPSVPSTAELFTVSSEKKPEVVLKPVISQPMATPQAALDQIAVYKRYFDARDDRGCEQEDQRLKITINSEGDDAVDGKTYYIQPSADPTYPGVEFIASPQENGQLDMVLILKICEDAADVAIAEYEKNPSAPKVNFEIPADVPASIRKAMQGIFIEKNKENPGAFLVNSVSPETLAASARRGPRPSSGSGDESPEG